MRTYKVTPLLDKKLRKIVKKDKDLHEILFKKIFEVTTVEDIHHYKNLKHPLEKLKRVHVKSSFVLLFTEKENHILFVDYDHHDKIYKSGNYQAWL